VFLIMFKTGHALPLVVTRILRPRIGRGGHAEFPRNVSHSRTWQQPIHGLDSAGNSPRAKAFHVREQSESAFNPSQQSWPRTIHVRARATALIVREQAAAADAKCPQTVRSRDLSIYAEQSRTQPVRKHGLAKSCPRHCIAVSVSPPVQFAIRVQIIPSHVLI
jgi:hypothetical protein